MRSWREWVWRSVLIVAVATATSAAWAQAVRQLTWDDLRPNLPPFDDPFEPLTQEQYYDIGAVIYLRERRARGEAVSPAIAERARKAAESLSRAGVDAEQLIARRDAVRVERQRRERTLNDKLDRARVRLPGFVLPIEYAGTRVSEFLLVPWVGACIHTPPPAPNQIVHVRMPRGAEFDAEGQFQAIWVNGELHASPRRTRLSLVDGAADIDVGYSMTATRVEKYSKP